MRLRFIISLVLSVHLAAQTPPAELRFEVVSIRETVTGVRVMGETNFSGSRAEYHGFSIPALIAEAWTVRGDEIVLAPGVSAELVFPILSAGRSARIYEIAALAAEGTTPTRDEFRRMLQSLLTTRFNLVTHREKRERPVYVLRTNGAPLLKPSSGDGRCQVSADRLPEGQRLVAKHCPIEVMIRNLFIDRPIYDETGLTGVYDFETTAALSFQASDPQAITPFSAVKDLHLKLDSERRPIDTIVIDHIERPSEN